MDAVDVTVWRDTSVGLEWALLYAEDAETETDAGYYDPADDVSYPIDGGIDPELVITQGRTRLFRLTVDNGLVVDVPNSIIRWAYSEADSLLIPEGSLCKYRLRATMDGHRVLIAKGAVIGQ